MTALYELGERYNQLLLMVDELDEDLFVDTLESIAEAFDDKVINTAGLINEINATSDVIGMKIKKLQERKKRFDNKSKRLNNYLLEEMEKTGKTIVTSDLYDVKVQNNPISVEIEDESEIPFGYYVKQPDKLDKSELKEDLKMGLEIPGVKLVSKKRLSIK